MTNWMIPSIYHSITVSPADGPQRVSGCTATAPTPTTGSSKVPRDTVGADVRFERS